MARVRFAEIVAVAALVGGLAACGSNSSKPAAAPVTVTSTVQSAPTSSAATTPGSGAGSTTAASGTSTSSAAQPSSVPSAKSSSTSSGGGGVANAGDQVSIVGTLQYLAPGKFIVHPDDGSTDQGFYVSDATKILGAAAICGGSDGNVTIGGDGYGTTKCTEDQLETAAKTNSVKVRVTMNRKSGSVQTVEEKYHP
ncbi:hypothetical protein KGQ20_05485 [Catenulispora sp. NF23]|uniref:Lipoprotein n=1 Tax=Catenulispora pinistramenti TaxID=2705254 RepID=A0ABS5KKK5_9ACTN|nr:hypothetical protein [Catenulispora pinistramenti]MBS2532218.1 hypothetical protein [Catenulispora pinistramenti]MBS2546381.1 hypothetical protein [Catenulispora pinistramenti]